ncbi:MAG TPA: hypothetical protein VHC97_07135 [Thermoanaerobaculia bacterium]|nr:hypothetical protein [Thermoanaerobaculia bacterium]
MWISLALALGLGCRGTPGGFVPLENGLKLVYDVDYVTGLGNVQSAEAIQRIDGKKTISGNEYFRVVLVVKGMPGWEPEVLYQRMAADGLHEVRYVGGKPVEYLAVPVPLTVGRTWRIDTSEININCRVDAHEPAILPEKTYEDAYRYSCSGTRGPLYFKNYTYMVQGVGVVKLVQESGALKMEMRLREVAR